MKITESRDGAYGGTSCRLYLATNTLSAILGHIRSSLALVHDHVGALGLHWGR